MKIENTLIVTIVSEITRLKCQIAEEYSDNYKNHLLTKVKNLEVILNEFRKHIDKEVMICDCETIVAKSNPLPPLDIEKAIAYKVYGQALENIPIGAMVMMNPENGHTFAYREKP